jgi:hypothetical protein
MSLRTPNLKPNPNVSVYRHGLLDDGLSIVSQLASERRKLLGRETTISNEPCIDIVSGRLLVYQPDASFADALAQYQTQGFFDEWDAPPWDTWIWYEQLGRLSQLGHYVSEGYLISWIPEMFQELAQKGIDVQPYGAIVWANQVDTPFLNQLKAEGVI